ncbi:MAG: 30S ribosomal protein S3ae, partial [Thermogladius sp.]
MAARKGVIKDKWKLKKWFNIVAPQSFGGVVLATTPSDDPMKLIGRTVETTLYDLTGDISQVHVKLYFQVVDVQGDQA